MNEFFCKNIADSKKILFLISFISFFNVFQISLCQTQTYSQYFVGGTTYAVGSTQCTAWNTFRSNINLSWTYTQVTMGAATATGAAAQTIVTNLKNGTAAGPISSGGYNWYVGTCGSGVELSANGGTCSCTNGYVVRPCIASNASWGGLTGGVTCSAASQTMTVTLTYTLPGPPCPTCQSLISPDPSPPSSATWTGFSYAGNLSFNMWGLNTNYFYQWTTGAVTGFSTTSWNTALTMYGASTTCPTAGTQIAYNDDYSGVTSLIAYNPGTTNIRMVTTDQNCNSQAGNTVYIKTRAIPKTPAISASESYVCPGAAVTLSTTNLSAAQDDGYMDVQWSTNNFATTFGGDNTTITVNPTAYSTTYYCRYIVYGGNTNYTSDVASVTVFANSALSSGVTVSSSGAPPGMSISFNPTTSVSLAKSGGILATYTATTPTCINWGVPLTLSVINAYSLFAPENAGNCTYNTMNINTTDLSLTNPDIGKLCYTGTTNIRYVNSSGVYTVAYNVPARIRIEVRDASNNPLPIQAINNTYIMVRAYPTFKVWAIVEIYPSGYITGALWGCMSGSNYGSSGWSPAVDVYNSLYTDPTCQICTQFAPAFYTLSPTTTAISAGPDQSLCLGGTINLNGTIGSLGCSNSNYSYYWSGPNGFTSNSQTSSVTNAQYANAGTYTYMVYDKACFGIDNMVATINAVPSITTQPTGGTICAGELLTLSVTANGGAPSLTYQWYNGGGAIGGATNSNYNATATGTYYCIVSASGSGCGSVTSNSETVTVVAPDPLSPTLLTNGDFIWSGQSSNDWNVPSNWLIYNGSGFSVAAVLPQTTNNVVIPGGAYNTTCVSTNPATIQTAPANCKKITIESGASLTVLNGQILNVYSDWKNDGQFDAGTGTVNFRGSTAISGSSINTFHNISILSSLTAPASGNINVTGNWNNSNSATFNHNSGTVTFIGTSEDQYYAASGTPAGKSFYNLIINTPLNFNVYSDYQVDNDFTLIAANHFHANDYAAMIYGNWTNIGGSYLNGHDEVTLAGSNKNIVINTTTYLHNLNITGSYTVTSLGFATYDNNLGEGGNLYISPAGILNANNSEIRVYGLWNNTGVFNKGTSRVLFLGHSQQEIRSGGYGFHNVDFLNGSAGGSNINISQPMTISGYTNFWDGIVYFTNTGSLTFTAGATTDGGDPSPSFVNGLVTKVGTNAFIFPVGEVVGSDAYWAPIGIAAPAGSSTITAQYKFDIPHDDGGNIIENYNSWMMCNPAELHHVSGVEYWKLTSDNAEPAVTLYWKDANRSQITNLPDLCVAHYEDCDGPGPGTNIKWAYKGGDPNAVGTLGVGGSGSVTSTIGFNSYSPITFGTRTSSNPLPINLLNFNAVCHNNEVDITWSTASETNNDFFTIQRSVDASSWKFVKSIPSGGNSNSTLYYSTTDKDPFSGTSYYRLKQTDYDGHSETFSPVAVACSGDYDSQSITYYPNPFTSDVIVDLRNINYETAALRIYNLLGEKVYEMILTSNESVNQEVKLDLHSLPAGVYSVTFNSDWYSNTSKIVKNY